MASPRPRTATGSSSAPPGCASGWKDGRDAPPASWWRRHSAWCSASLAERPSRMTSPCWRSASAIPAVGRLPRHRARTLRGGTPPRPRLQQGDEREERKSPRTGEWLDGSILSEATLGTGDCLEGPLQQRVLLVNVRSRACALRIGDCIEVMRPLPVEGLTGAPPFVAGLARIRGGPVPVVDLAELLGIASEPPPEPCAPRYVLLRVGERRVALRVDAVPGVLEMDGAAMQALPPPAACDRKRTSLRPWRRGTSTSCSCWTRHGPSVGTTLELQAQDATPCGGDG